MIATLSTACQSFRESAWQPATLDPAVASVGNIYAAQEVRIKYLPILHPKRPFPDTDFLFVGRLYKSDITLTIMVLYLVPTSESQPCYNSTPVTQK